MIIVSHILLASISTQAIYSAGTKRWWWILEVLMWFIIFVICYFWLVCLIAFYINDLSSINLYANKEVWWESYHTYFHNKG